MNKRTLGNSDLEIKHIGFGASPVSFYEMQSRLGRKPRSFARFESRFDPQGSRSEFEALERRND